MPGSFIGIIHANIPEFMKKAEGRDRREELLRVSICSSEHQ
jgi:hypothetical protein